MMDYTLMKLTNQESGIMVYDKDVLVANWSNCNVGELPMLNPIGMPVNWPSYDLIVTERYQVDDIRKALPGSVITAVDAGGYHQYQDMNVLYDRFGDIPALWGCDIGLGANVQVDESNSPIPTPGMVYRLNNGERDILVIAPQDWN